MSNELTVTEFYDALNKSDKEYSAMSWSGFNLFGDKKSINELNRLISLETRLKWLEREYERLSDGYERHVI